MLILKVLLWGLAYKLTISVGTHDTKLGIFSSFRQLLIKRGDVVAFFRVG
ncbi:hypothetical protein SBF1_2510003 [Candidatus Desulfosporosinus infrequens]|uniref:Uncharacterized protein n=1 Tax=Candidatus Desulfosporosinus infrequens TaxID=2043169 RepID=A0A2U3KPJ1_9FIRM|nr:hypothetical protein SBF1_2510003 [Candidatus Desulfosporosinus infrequens]